jgi:UDP-2,3-diacylglucosamine pyrophosphatase LpxH
MKYKAIIVSDLHLGTKSSNAKDFIDFLDENSTELLILNGDIIDGWALSRGSKWKKQHTKVIAKLLKLSTKTKIIWIRGNHDEFIEEFIPIKFSNIEIKENHILELYKNVSGDHYVSRNYFIFHGDIIDVFITKYKWLSKIGAIGYDLALWLNRIYNNYRKFRNLPYESISKKIKSGVKLATNYINDFENAAIKIAKKENCVGVICGHIHEPKNVELPDGHYLNSGDWVENKSAIVLTKNDEFSIVFY